MLQNYKILFRDYTAYPHEKLKPTSVLFFSLCCQITVYTPCSPCLKQAVPASISSFLLLILIFDNLLNFLLHQSSLSLITLLFQHRNIHRLLFMKISQPDTLSYICRWIVHSSSLVFKLLFIELNQVY